MVLKLFLGAQQPVLLAEEVLLMVQVEDERFLIFFPGKNCVQRRDSNVLIKQNAYFFLFEPLIGFKHPLHLGHERQLVNPIGSLPILILMQNDLALVSCLEVPHQSLEVSSWYLIKEPWRLHFEAS